MTDTDISRAVLITAPKEDLLAIRKSLKVGHRDNVAGFASGNMLVALGRHLWHEPATATWLDYACVVLGLATMLFFLGRAIYDHLVRRKGKEAFARAEQRALTMLSDTTPPHAGAV